MLPRDETFHLRNTLSILTLFLLIQIARPATAVIIVDGVGPDESNCLPGIQNTTVTCTTPSGSTYTERPDSSVDPTSGNYKRFRTLQSALFAIENNMVGNDRLVRIRTAAPLRGYDPNVPSNVSSRIFINREVTVESGGTSRAIIDGGSSVVTVNSIAVDLKRLEIRNGTNNGIAINSAARGIATRGVLLEDVDVHSNGNGVLVRGSNQYIAIAIVTSNIHDNTGSGVFVAGARADLSIRGRGNRKTRIVDHPNGYGIYALGANLGSSTFSAALRLADTEVLNSGRSGVFATNNVRFIMEDSVVDNHDGFGVYVNNPPAIQPLAAPVFRRSTITNNKRGGVWLKDTGGYIANFTRTTIRRNQGFGLLLENVSARLLSGNNISDNLRDPATATRTGSGVRVRDRSLVTIDDARISNNGSTGVLVSDSQVTITGSRIVDNHYHGVSGQRSRIAVSAGTEIAESEQAGIIATRQSEITATNIDVRNNNRSGIRVDQSTLVADNVRLTGNKWRGIFARESRVEVKNSTLTDNSTVLRDPAITLEERSKGVIGPNNKILGNRGSGIAVYDSPGAIRIHDNIIRNNNTDVNGGGILVWDAPPVRNGSNPTIEKNEIADNTATGSGGGIAVIDSRATLRPAGTSDRITIRNNTTTDGSGGGILVYQPAGKVRMERTTIELNKATSALPGRSRGGGIQVFNGPTSTVVAGRAPVEIVRDNHILNNSALRGGIGVVNADVVIGNSAPGARGGNLIRENTARARDNLGAPNPMGIGAGIYIANPTDTLTNRIQGNVIIQNKGTAIHLEGGGKHHIWRNLVGIDSAGVAKPNVGHGISMRNSSGNTIGKGNTIANNEGSGVSVGTGAVRNTITKNSITRNRDLGIDLWRGGNNSVEAPDIEVSTAARVDGRAASAPGSTVEVYEDNEGEGESFKAPEVALIADQTFKKPDSYRADGALATATVTDLAGNTSEFGFLFDMSAPCSANEREAIEGIFVQRRVNLAGDPVFAQEKLLMRELELHAARKMGGIRLELASGDPAKVAVFVPPRPNVPPVRVTLPYALPDALFDANGKLATSIFVRGLDFNDTDLVLKVVISSNGVDVKEDRVRLRIGDPPQYVGSQFAGGFPHWYALPVLNRGDSVSIAVDPTIHDERRGLMAHAYLVEHKTLAAWTANPALADVTGAVESFTISASPGQIQDNIRRIWAAATLAPADREKQFDVILDFGDCSDTARTDARLDPEDLVLPLSNEANALVVVPDLTTSSGAIVTAEYGLDFEGPHQGAVCSPAAEAPLPAPTCSPGALTGPAACLRDHLCLDTNSDGIHRCTPIVPAACAAGQTCVSTDNDEVAHCVVTSHKTTIPNGYDGLVLPVPGFDFRLRGKIVRPASGSNPLVVLAHGRHAPKIVSRGGRRWHETASGTTSDQNYRGFTYLQEHLARHGYATLSIDLDETFGLRGYPSLGTGPLTSGGILLRGWLLLKNLEHALATPGLLAGRVDTSRLHFFGHSRGGQAVIAARNLIENVGSAGPAGATLAGIGAAGIVSVTSVAPTSFDAGPTMPPSHREPPLGSVGSTSFFLVHGTRDGDVNGYLPGVQPALLLDLANNERAGMNLYGANHNYFNTSWPANDHPLAPAAGLSEAEQRDYLKSYYLAWLRVQEDRPGYEAFFVHPPERLRLTGTGSYRMTSEAHIATPDVLDDFETNAATATASSGAAVTMSVANESEIQLYDEFIFPDPETEADNRFIHETTGLVFDWTGGQKIEYSLPASVQDLRGAGTLTFRVAQAPRHSLSTPPADKSFNVVLIDDSGNETRIPSDFSGVMPGHYDTTVDPHPSVGPMQMAKDYFSMLRIDVDRFVVNSPTFDLGNVRTLRFEFGPPGAAAGRIAIDDIRLEPKP